MFWTSKDKPSASDTATQSCSLWQRWVSERNIGRSSVLTNSFPGFSGLDSLRLCFLPDFSPGHSRPGLSNIGLLQPAGDQLPVWRTSEWRVSHSVTTRLVLLIFCPRFYSDEEAFCQMYHMCVAESSGSFKKFSFLCPNGQPTVHSQFYLLYLLFTSSISGTIFNQEKLVCDAWFNVDCSEDTITNDASALDLLDAERTFITLGLESDEPEKDYPWRFRSTK